MQKKLRNSVFLTTSLFLSALVFISANVIRKSRVSFNSEDGLTLTADQYITSSDYPYIILFHEQESSRGEFNTIARRLCKMDYNCLAVDLRNGGSKNFVSNETAKQCRETRCPTSSADVELDIIASINFAVSQSNQDVIIFGSGANGSLALKIANENKHVKAVVALSPGEYFLPQLSIQDTIAGLQKPVFISSSLSEFSYVSQLASELDEEYVTLFEPQLGEGARGTAALSSKNEHNSEYWLALLLFFKDLV